MGLVPRGCQSPVSQNARPRLLRGPGRTGGSGGHKVRIFLKWTAGEAGGVGPTPRYMAVCPMGFGTSSSCPPPWAGAAHGPAGCRRRSQAECLGRPGARLLVRVASYPISPTGRDIFPRLCWLDGAGHLHPSCPGRTVQVVVPVCVGRRRANSPATAHPSP